MLLRRRSSRSLLTAKVLGPLVALGIVAVALGRRSRAASPLPMPRLPVRRKPAPPSSSRLRRLNAPPLEVEPPDSFWDARERRESVDDPAEIPDHASPLVSEASQAAAGVAPGAFYDGSAHLRW